MNKNSYNILTYFNIHISGLWSTDRVIEIDWEGLFKGVSHPDLLTDNCDLVTFPDAIIKKWIIWESDL